MESGRETERERAARARKQTRNHDTAAAYGPLCVALVYTLSRERERELARERGRESIYTSQRARAMEGREERAHEVF